MPRGNDFTGQIAWFDVVGGNASVCVYGKVAGGPLGEYYFLIFKGDDSRYWQTDIYYLLSDFERVMENRYMIDFEPQGMPSPQRWIWQDMSDCN